MDTKECYSFVLFGDSITKGVVYDNEKSRYVTLKNSFSNIIQSMLKGNIFNSGKFGSTITRGEQKLESDVIKKNPDVVLIEFGGNDCDFDWDAIANNPEGSFEPKTDLNLFERKLNSLIEYFNKLNIVPALMTLPPLDADRYFKWVSKNNPSAQKNILSWLGSINKIYWWHERYNSAIMEVAEKTKTRLIDVRGAFLKQNDYRQFMCIDGIHPNEQGHSLIANKILDYMKTNYSFLLKPI